MRRNNFSKIKIAASPEEESEDVGTFDDFNLFVKNEKLLRGIFAYGFTRPSKIQALAVSPIREKKDLIAQSQSGTEKRVHFRLVFLK